MIDLNNIEKVYLVGIGGIGMSALARYFREKGTAVKGYDRAPSPLTLQMEAEGIQITYQSNPEQVSPLPDLVIYTPAIPADDALLSFFRSHKLPVFKRSEVLQEITKDMFCITIAGTHGKTTISTLIAHILRESGFGCTAFLGGVSVNYNTNYWSSKNNVAVIEADEYDRSFLRLQPDIAVLTAMDADHLDIYGTEEAMQDAYIQYTRQIKPNGKLIYKVNLVRQAELGGKEKMSYSLDNKQADWFAQNTVIQQGGYTFDIHHKGGTINDVALPIGGMHNVENAVAATVAAVSTGIDQDKIKTALGSFKGVKRRFEYIINTNEYVYIDDYAHHPEELHMLISSAKALFPKRDCTVVFQPHLFSRTRDLADAFAKVLDQADVVLLLPIYPAREAPIPGISSQTIADKMKNKNVHLLSKPEVLSYLQTHTPPLTITAGAGDIDRMGADIKGIFIPADIKQQNIS